MSSQRILHVYHKDWKAKHAHILDSDKSTTLYDIDIHTSAPNLIFQRPSSVSQFATAGIGYTGSSFDFTLNSQPLHLQAKDWKQMTYLYTSSFFGGTITWKMGMKGGTMLAESKLPIAKCTMSTLAMKKVGTIEIMEANMPQEGLDEIVIMAAAILMRSINPRIKTAAKSVAAAAS